MIILASASPRRIEMLTNAGLDPVVRPASIIETLPFPMNPETATMYLALKKASAVYDEISPTSNCTIIGADTVVVHEGRIIGKPADKQEAYSILSRLRATSHHVITGCCVIKMDGNNTSNSSAGNSVGNGAGNSVGNGAGNSFGFATNTCFYEDTKVFFKNYSTAELEEYLSTDEAYDKAGGYAIQGSFSKYIDHIEGDYNNVVGLPLAQVIKHLSLLT